MIKTHGIHHISSIVGHAQRNIDFYAGVLGLRLVKKTLNYDDKDTYHLYYGNQDASSGLVTTFPWNDAVEGELGGGQVSIASYGIRPESFEFYKNRLDSFGIKHFEYTRFNRRRLGFKDMDGLQLELIETDKGQPNTWQFNGITSKDAIIGIEDAVLLSQAPERTLQVLTEVLGYQLIESDSENYLLKINDDLGGILELAKEAAPQGSMGVGTVHHIAFTIKDDEIGAWRGKLVDLGFNVTQEKDRKYFKSLYFREVGGILIELATEGPGMIVDEPVDTLGQELIYPEHFRGQIDENLMPIMVREVKELKGYGYRDKFEYEHLKRRESILDQIKVIKSKEVLDEQDKLKLEQLKKEYINKGEK